MRLFGVRFKYAAVTFQSAFRKAEVAETGACAAAGAGAPAFRAFFSSRARSLSALAFSIANYKRTCAEFDELSIACEAEVKPPLLALRSLLRLTLFFLNLEYLLHEECARGDENCEDGQQDPSGHDERLPAAEIEGA